MGDAVFFFFISARFETQLSQHLSQMHRLVAGGDAHRYSISWATRAKRGRERRGGEAGLGEREGKKDKHFQLTSPNRKKSSFCLICFSCFPTCRAQPVQGYS